MGATPVAVMPPVAWHEVVHLRPAELRLRIERMPEATWSRDPAALLGLAMAHRSPGSTNPYAAEPYLDAADELLADGVGEPALHVLAPIVRSIPLRELGAFDQARGLLACAARELSAARLPCRAPGGHPLERRHLRDARRPTRRGAPHTPAGTAPRREPHSGDASG